jgi:hypothetical protein
MDRQALLGRAGPMANTCGRAWHGRDRAVLMAGARGRDRAGSGSQRTTGRGVAEAGGAGPNGTRPGLGRVGRGRAWLRQEGLGRERLGQGRCALQDGARRLAHDCGKAGPGRGRAGWGRPGQSRGGQCVGSGESGWSVRGEETARRRRAGRAGKNEKMNGIHKLGDIRTHLILLSFLTWPRNISYYGSRGSDVAEEHKDPSYVPRLG